MHLFSGGSGTLKLWVQCSKVLAVDPPSIYETFKRENFITHHQFKCSEI